MSASSMTAFVRNLFKQADDYRSLTQRIIRDRYMQHANLDSLDDDQRSLLREIVQIMVAEMVQNEESNVSNEEVGEREIHSLKVEEKSRQNSRQQKQTKVPADSREGENDAGEEEAEQEEEEKEEEDRSKKRRRLDSSEDSESDSERTLLAKKKKPKTKIVDTSSESDGDNSTKAKGLVTALKKQQKMRTKTVSQKKDSDMSATEPEDTYSDSEKVKSSKSKELPRQSTKKPPESGTIAGKRKLSELSYDQSSSNKNHKQKMMKKTISSDSQPSSDEETNPESDGSESAQPQKQIKKRQAKTETKKTPRKIKPSKSSEDEPPSDKESNSDSRKKILGSDDSDDGESLQQLNNKWSVSNKASEGDAASARDDLGTSRKKKTDKSENSVNPVSKGMASSINNSSSEDEQALVNIKKKFQKATSDSDDESSSKAETSKKSVKARDKDKRKSKKSTEKKKPSKTSTQGDDKDENVKKLERIARSCGILPVGKRYKLAFENCRDNKERSAKLKQMLRDAGMTGKISMKSAETLKLKREAAELLSNTVIITEGRGRRRASNPLAGSDRRRDREQSLSPPPSAKESFSRLKGIVDSEEDSD